MRITQPDEVRTLREQGAALRIEQLVAAATQLASKVLGQKSATGAWLRDGGDASFILAPGIEHRNTSGSRSRTGDSLTITPAGQLTQRERMVLQHLVEGRTDREIAARLFISRRTVSKHLEAIFAKLRVHSRGAAVAEAHRLGVAETALLEGEKAATAFN